MARRRGGRSRLSAIAGPAAERIVGDVACLVPDAVH